MTNEQAIVYLESLKEYVDKIAYAPDMYEAIDKAIQTLEQQPCDDAVSRKFVGIVISYPQFCVYEEYKGKPYFSIKYTENGQEFIGFGTYKLEVLSEYLRNYFLTPQRKHGKWIEVDICNCHATLKCSVCDRVIEPTFTFDEYSYEDIKEFYPFCHCGADMRGDENE